MENDSESYGPCKVTIKMFMFALVVIMSYHHIFFLLWMMHMCIIHHSNGNMLLLLNSSPVKHLFRWRVENKGYFV